MTLHRDEFLSVVQFCALLDICTKTAERQRLRGDGPAYTRVGKRRIVYRKLDVDNWLKANSFRHRAEEATASKAA